MRWRTISSRKNGLPSERSRTRPAHGLRQLVDVEQERNELGALLAVERIEGKRAEASSPAAPVGARAEQIRDYLDSYV